jgi:hypothetical protein
MLRITKLLPKGDIPEPNNTLQVQWLYMSFHCSDHAEYVRSGRKLNDETLQTLVEYFESIFLAQFGDGSIQQKHDDQLRTAAKRKLCRKLEEHYRHKLKKLVASRDCYSSSKYRGERVGRPIFFGDCCHPKTRHSSYRNPHQDCQDCQDCKAPPKDGKIKKLCHLHGSNSKHSYDKCRQNPRNQVRNSNNNNYIKKRAHDMHYHDGRHHGSKDELLTSCTSAAHSNDELSANESGGEYAPENYHLDSFQQAKKRKVGDVGHKSSGNNTLVEPDFSWNLDAIFNDDVTADSFLKAFQEDSGLAMRDDDDAFKFNN